MEDMPMPALSQAQTDELKRYFPAIFAKAETDRDIAAALQNAAAALASGGISWAGLNQIMHFCSQPGMSEGFYRYYFLGPRTATQSPPYSRHPYRVQLVSGVIEYEPRAESVHIGSFQQFAWGIRRFIYDAMLWWGNFRQAYEDLCLLDERAIADLFAAKRVDTERLIRRGAVAGPEDIAYDLRYLTSEIASHSLEGRSRPEEIPQICLAVEAFREVAESGPVTPEVLRERARMRASATGQLALFDLMYEDASRPVTCEDDVVRLYDAQVTNAPKVREQALRNTRTYLSICSDLDVYVATSMRSRADFEDVAKTCADIFGAECLKSYGLRYFDPTQSVAQYHEDKGIIECLMVKMCKVLVYFAQHKESLGKVSEYAMALSLGKPVIILCPDDPRGSEIFTFYRDRHPLLRLIEFESGIVNGAMVTQSVAEVVELLARVFANNMQYDLDIRQDTRKYFLLRERRTRSTVRVITEDRMLTEAFWNNYRQAY